MVVLLYTVVARQCASDTWVPPERAALAGRRALNGENWLGGSPAGLRRERERCLARLEADLGGAGGSRRGAMTGLRLTGAGGPVEAAHM
ncbi:hypothetical protein B0T18DRAFT_421638 [Schizothecium vesticola]|uniref:Uncharacterized protein n=1 Tax=Schizothecium vesticola TaxID=314040 RepID=A0AA40BPZ9_9PEZI|nr:hypothetical protein B0T18DRAFT_421638 [Schizothecium vesticola]